MSGANSPVPVSPAETAGPRILGATLTTTCLAMIFGFARLYVRRFIIRALGWDDLAIAVALAISIAGEVMVIFEVKNGGGQHISNVPPTTYIRGMLFNFATQPTYLWAICIVKMSVGFALLRIAVDKGWRITIQSIMGFMLFYTFGCFLTIMLQCKQLSALWDPATPRQCWSKTTLQALSYTNVALNILTDFTFAVVIPIPMLWNLRMNARTKGSVIAVLALGVFACIAAIAKIPSLVNYGKQGDFLWDSRDITIWTITECNVGIIAASLPALKPLFKPLLGSSYARNISKTYAHGSSSRQRVTNPHTFTSPQVFRSLDSGRGSRDGEDEYEAKSQMSQQNLVENENIPLGVIEKTVTSTVTVTHEEIISPSNQPYPWQCVHAS